MDDRISQRIIGIGVIAVLAIVCVPEILDGGSNKLSVTTAMNMLQSTTLQSQLNTDKPALTFSQSQQVPTDAIVVPQSANTPLSDLNTEVSQQDKTIGQSTSSLFSTVATPTNNLLTSTSTKVSTLQQNNFDKIAHQDARHKINHDVPVPMHAGETLSWKEAKRIANEAVVTRNITIPPRDTDKIKHNVPSETHIVRAEPTTHLVHSEKVETTQQTDELQENHNLEIGNNKAQNNKAQVSGVSAQQIDNANIQKAVRPKAAKVTAVVPTSNPDALPKIQLLAKSEILSVKNNSHVPIPANITNFHSSSVSSSVAGSYSIQENANALRDYYLVQNIRAVVERVTIDGRQIYQVRIWH
jgi:hypothetical protein